MNTLFSYIEWLFPLLIIPTSYVLFRFVPFRKVRFQVYAVILVMAFFFDLFKISFKSEVLDSVLYFSVLGIITEFVWNSTKLKRKIISGAVLVLFLPGFLYLNSAWLRAGADQREFRRNTVVDVHSCNSVEYALEKRLSRNWSDSSYKYILNRSIPRSPLEKQIDTYTTREGYFQAQFEYVWNCVDEGVKLDLVVGKDTLWSLGETCKKQF